MVIFRFLLFSLCSSTWPLGHSNATTELRFVLFFGHRPDFIDFTSHALGNVRRKMLGF